MSQETVSAVVALFGELAVPAFGIAFVFAFGSKLINSFLRMAMGERFKL